MRTYLQTYRPMILAMLVMICLATFGLGNHAAYAATAVPFMALNTTPFPIIPELQAIAIAYRNPSLIADSVLPRVDVSTKTFKYAKYPKGTFFTIPDTKVGRKGEPNTVELEAEDASASCNDHGLDDVVPNEDVEAARSNNRPDPMMKATEFLTDLVLLAREKRTADLVFDDTQYASANKITLAGNDQWSSTHANSDPVDDILTGLDACVMRPNIMVIGQLAFTKLATHTKIAAAIFKNGSTAGIASRQQIAELFELEEILVGQGFVNTAKKGQTATLTRVWGKHCLLAYRNRNVTAERGVSFGFTGQWGSRVAGSMAEPRTGLRGSNRVRVGESVKELLTANDLGYFLKDVIA